MFMSSGTGVEHLITESKNTAFRQMSSNKNNVNRIPQDELAMRAILKDMGITGTLTSTNLLSTVKSC